MTYTKFHDPWGSGSCCGSPDPGPNTPIVKAALNAWESGIFDAHTLFAAAPTDEMQSSRVTGDAERRYQQLADGTIRWGDGTNPYDVDLYRSGPGVLRTTNQFSINRTGDAADAELRLSADAGFLNNIRFRTGSLDRWGIQKDAVAETGANAGSNFMIQRFDDAGVFVSNVLNIIRSTGVVSITSPGVANGAVVSVDGTQPITNKTIQGSAAVGTTGILSHKVTGDTQVRWVVDANGKMSWSPGAGALDTTLERGAAGQLLTNADVHSVRVSTAVAFSGMVVADTNNRWQVTVNGVQTWGPGNAATDCTFGRSSAGVLRAVSTAIQVTQTNATFGAIQTMVVGADTQPRFGVLAGGDIQWGPGNAAVDCTFTRTGVGAMTLSAAIRINGNVGFYNTAPVAKPTVTGSRGGNAALASLLTSLASQGLITDSSTA